MTINISFITTEYLVPIFPEINCFVPNIIFNFQSIYGKHGMQKALI